MRPQRRGIAMIVIGAVLMLVLAPLSAVLGFVVGLKDGMGHITDAPIVAAGRPHHLPSGASVMLFAYAGPSSAGTGISGSGSLAPATCTVTTSNGTPVDVTAQSGIQVTRGGSAYDMAGHFTAPADGDYAIRCGDHPAVVLDTKVANHLMRSIFLPIGVGVGTAVVIGIIGLILLVVGIVRLVRSNRRIREFDQGGGPGYPGGLPYGPGPPPRYPPPTYGQGPRPTHGEDTAYPPPPDDPYPPR